MKSSSLSGRLLAWVIATLVAVWTGFVAVGYLTGIEEAGDLSHAQLANVAELILGDGSTAPAVVDEYRSVLTVVVWDADGRVIQHLGPAAAPPFTADEGFWNQRLGEPAVDWRSFSRWSSGEPRQKVMVMVDASLIDELSWDMAGDIATPGIWLLPLAVLVLGAVVRRGLRPLLDLSTEVSALDIRHPTPLKAGHRHEELRAVAGAIDALAERYLGALQRERQLASELAHELRTPLTSLALQADLLRQSLSEPDRQAALLRLEQDALRTGKVLTALLAMARASRAEMSDAAEPVDLTALARRVTGEYAQAALTQGHDMSFDGESALIVQGHPTLLELALRNLIDNALGHTAPGTRIEVQVDAVARFVQVCDDGAAGVPADSAHTLGLGLGHRVIDKVASVHQAQFGAVPPPPGFACCYRIWWGDAAPSP